MHFANFTKTISVANVGAVYKCFLTVTERDIGQYVGRTSIDGPTLTSLFVYTSHLLVVYCSFIEENVKEAFRWLRW